jgi:hypothetical protein
MNTENLVAAQFFPGIYATGLLLWAFQQALLAAQYPAQPIR